MHILLNAELSFQLALSVWGNLRSESFKTRKAKVRSIIIRVSSGLLLWICEMMNIPLTSLAQHAILIVLIKLATMDVLLAAAHIALINPQLDRVQLIKLFWNNNSNSGCIYTVKNQWLSQ